MCVPVFIVCASWQRPEAVRCCIGFGNPTRVLCKSINCSVLLNHQGLFVVVFLVWNRVSLCKRLEGNLLCRPDWPQIQRSASFCLPCDDILCIYHNSVCLSGYLTFDIFIGERPCLEEQGRRLRKALSLNLWSPSRGTHMHT